MWLGMSEPPSPGEAGWEEYYERMMDIYDRQTQRQEQEDLEYETYMIEMHLRHIKERNTMYTRFIWKLQCSLEVRRVIQAYLLS